MRLPARILLTAGTVAASGAALLLAMSILYGQRTIEGFRTGSGDSGLRILIASQGSDFKEALVDSVVARLSDRDAWVEVVDVTSLPGIDPAGWDAIVILCTTEMNRIQGDAGRFLASLPDQGNVVLVQTSGSGDLSSSDYAFDAITSASALGDLDRVTREVDRRLEGIL